jgi:hypothetical protein
MALIGATNSFPFLLTPIGSFTAPILAIASYPQYVSPRSASCRCSVSYLTLGVICSKSRLTRCLVYTVSIGKQLCMYIFGNNRLHKERSIHEVYTKKECKYSWDVKWHWTWRMRCNDITATVFTKTKIWSQPHNGARHQDTLPGTPLWRSAYLYQITRRHIP